MQDEIICLTLEWFKRNKESLKGDEKSCLPLRKAHHIIRADEDDYYIAYGYRVTPQIAENLQPYYQHQIDFTKYDYFVWRYSNYKCVNGKPVRVDP